jgi:rhodanese-related sulfurtransferase
MKKETVAAVALAAAGAAFAGSPVTPDELAVQIKDGEAAPFVLDVRTTDEFASGRVPGATNIPIQVLEGRVAEVPKDRPVVVYCEVGGRSARAGKLLAERGYDVRELAGSMSAWRKAGLPVEK